MSKAKDDLIVNGYLYRKGDEIPDDIKIKLPKELLDTSSEKKTEEVKSNVNDKRNR